MNIYLKLLKILLFITKSDNKVEKKWAVENTTQDANSIKIPMVLHYVDGDYNTSHLPEYWRDAVIMNVGHSESYYMQLAFHTSANILAIRYFRYGANFSNWRTI